eukprot:2218860-Pleurochrysis_carterae.AAC.1
MSEGAGAVGARRPLPTGSEILSACGVLAKPAEVRSLRGSRGLPGGWTRCYPYAPKRGVSPALHIVRPVCSRSGPVPPTPKRGMVGGENFSFARPHGGDAIVRADSQNFRHSASV